VLKSKTCVKFASNHSCHASIDLPPSARAPSVDPAVGLFADRPASSVLKSLDDVPESAPGSVKRRNTPVSGTETKVGISSSRRAELLAYKDEIAIHLLTGRLVKVDAGTIEA
jgi:hypothetical protein